MAHIVTATMIVAKVGDAERYLDQGAILPEGVDAKERKRLLALGLIAVAKAAPALSAAAKAKADAEAKEKADAEAKEKADAAEAAKAAAAKEAAEKTATK